MNESDNQRATEMETQMIIQHSNSNSAETQIELLKMINQSLRLESMAKDNEISILKEENTLLKKEIVLLKRNFGKFNKILFLFLKKSGIDPGLYKALQGQKGGISSKNKLSYLETDNLADDFDSARDFNKTTPAINFTARASNFTAGASNFTAGTSKCFPRAPFFFIRASNFTARSFNFISGNPNFTAKAPNFISRDFDFISGGSNFTPRDSDFISAASNLTSGAINNTYSASGLITEAPGVKFIAKTDPATAGNNKAKSDHLDCKVIDFESVVKEIIHKDLKHQTYIENGVVKTRPNKNEKHTADLILKALDASYKLTEDLQKNRFITYKMIMDLRREFSPRNTVITTFIKLTNVFFYLYRNGKFTINDLRGNFRLSKTYCYNLVNILKEKEWIEEFIPRRSDAFYCSQKFRLYVESIVSSV